MLERDELLKSALSEAMDRLADKQRAPIIFKTGDSDTEELIRLLKKTREPKACEPIVEFKNEAQAYEYLREWQTRLFLDDWTIKIHFADELHDEETGDELSGQNRFDMTNKCCVISFAKLDEDKKSRIQRISQEHILVHELLHCKQGWLSPPSSMEGKYYDTIEHGLLEQMAKSLIMAKYNLSFDWFKNF